MNITKAWIAGSILGAQIALPGLSQTAIAADFKEVQRDVEVMTKALQAATNTAGEKQAGLAKVEGMYLADQGVVFRLHARGLSSHATHQMFYELDFENMGHDIGVYVDGVMEDVEAGLANLSENHVFIEHDGGEHGRTVEVEKFDFDWQDQYEEMAEQLSEQSRKLSQQIRDLRKGQSQAQRSYRDAQRSFEKKLEEHEAKLEAGQTPAETKSFLENAEQALSQARKSYRKTRAEFAKKMEAIKSEQRAERVLKIETLTRETIASFCRYGTSLRSIPETEHITLVFDGMGSADSRKEDLFYVIKKKDYSDCQKGKLDGAQLMSKAQHYAF